ncbi:MAG: hypothetical protein HFH90_15675 [Lachnospiraceae bacterium]|nr:hypothetical protein [Lachnospiraceae bacterium]
MDYKEFIEQVKRDLPGRLTGDLKGASVEDSHVEKLQNASYDGIAIRPENGSMGISMSMEGYFAAVENGTPYQEVIGQIAEEAEESYRDRPVVRPEDYRDYEKMKPSLMVQLVGQEGNEAMLEKIPYQDMVDMAVVYWLDFGMTEEGRATALITNGLLESYGISQEQLHRDAMEQAARKQPFEIKGMNEMLAELMGGDAPMNIGRETMYVATNPSRMFGASVIAYPDFMEAAAEKMGGDFYVLPSSVHETILVPDDGKEMAAGLRAMVQDVNEVEVDPKERLSNEAYHYDSKDKVFERADRFEERRAEKEKGCGERSSVLGELSDRKKECSERPRKEPSHKREDMAL